MISTLWAVFCRLLLVAAIIGGLFLLFAEVPVDMVDGTADSKSDAAAVKPLPATATKADLYARQAELFQELDSLHVEGVSQEASLMMSRDSRAYLRYRQYTHTWMTGFKVTYHRNCSICDANFRIYKELDENFDRVAAWDNSSRH